MRTVEATVIDESTTPIYGATIKDAEGTVIPLAQIGTLKLTWFNVETRTKINNRNGQDVLNLNGVTVHATTGRLTWQMAQEDTTIETIAKAYEDRVAQFVWTYAGTKKGVHERLFHVRNLEHIP